MKKTILLSLLVALTYSTIAQVSILSTAQVSGDTLFCNGGNTNKSAVAYNPDKQLYYSNNPSNREPEEYYDINGVFLGDTLLTDWRGMWYNTTTKTIEGNTWGGGLSIDSLSENGIFNGGYTGMGFQANMPNIQSAGVLDYKDNEILYYDSDSIYALSRADGTILPTMALTGITDFSTIVAWSIIYTGIEKNEIGIYDKSNKELHLFDKATFSLTTTVKMPTEASGTPASWGIAYANDIFWLYNSGINDWIGYDIFEIKSASIPYYSIALDVYPNPTSGIITIDTDKAIDQIQVLNLAGQVIKTLTQTDNHINVSDLNPGVYLLQVSGQVGVGYSRFIKN